MKIPRQISLKLVVVLLLISVIGTAAALVTLFTHHFPGVGTTAPAYLSTPANCNSTPTTVNLVVSPTSVAAFSASPAYILAQCPGPTAGSTVAAFTTAATGQVPVTPFFGLPAGYSALAIITHTATTSCSPSSAAYTAIMNNMPITLATSSSFDYCVTVAPSAPTGGLLGFDIDWEQ